MPLFGGSGSRSPRSGYYGEGRGYAGSGYGGDAYGYSGYNNSSRYQTQEVRPSSSSSRRYGDSGSHYEDAGSRYESLSNWQGAGLSRSRSGYPDSSARDRAAARSREVFMTGPGLSRYEESSRRPDDGARFRAASQYEDDRMNAGGNESTRSYRGYAGELSRGYASADYFSSSGECAREQRSYARTSDGRYIDPFQASLNAERSRGFGYGAEYGRSDGGMDRLARKAHLRNHNLDDRFNNYQHHGGGAYGRFAGR